MVSTHVENLEKNSKIAQYNSNHINHIGED